MQLLLDRIIKHAGETGLTLVTPPVLGLVRFSMFLTRLFRYTLVEEYDEIVPIAALQIQRTQEQLLNPTVYQQAKLELLVAIDKTPKLAELDLFNRREEKSIRDFVFGNVF